MPYINVGVQGATTKKALREAMTADPSTVYVYSTALMGQQYNGPVSAMPEGYSLTVAGPDPYKHRDWFATITRSRDGSKFKVS